MRTFKSYDQAPYHFNERPSLAQVLFEVQIWDRQLDKGRPKLVGMFRDTPGREPLFRWCHTMGLPSDFRPRIRSKD